MVFSCDEDRSIKFYVTDVKYYAPFGTVCYFCVSSYGDVTTAKLSVVDLHKSINAEENIYDCNFVRGNVFGYI